MSVSATEKDKLSSGGPRLGFYIFNMPHHARVFWAGIVNSELPYPKIQFNHEDEVEEFNS